MWIAFDVSGLEVAGPTQVEALVRIEIHQSQHERFTRSWVGRDDIPSQPWSTIALDVDVQFGARTCFVYHSMAEVYRYDRAFAVSIEGARCCASGKAAAESN